MVKSNNLPKKNVGYMEKRKKLNIFPKRKKKKHSDDQIKRGEK